MQPYPRIIDETVQGVLNALRQITRYRDEDITDRNNFSSIFQAGRSVGKIPTSSNDIVATDRVGDVSFAADGSYVYYCVNASGAAKWRRVALSTW